MTYFKTRGLVFILFFCCFREVILVMNYRFTSWALGSIRVRGWGGERRLKLREIPNHWAAEVTLARLPTVCLRHHLILVPSLILSVSHLLLGYSQCLHLCVSLSLCLCFYLFLSLLSFHLSQSLVLIETVLSSSKESRIMYFYVCFIH